MIATHNEALTVLVNWAAVVGAISVLIGVVAFLTRGKDTRADDAKQRGGKR